MMAERDFVRGQLWAFDPLRISPPRQIPPVPRPDDGRCPVTGMPIRTRAEKDARDEVLAQRARQRQEAMVVSDKRHR